MMHHAINYSADATVLQPLSKLVNSTPGNPEKSPTGG